MGVIKHVPFHGPEVPPGSLTNLVHVLLFPELGIKIEIILWVKQNKWAKE